MWEEIWGQTFRFPLLVLVGYDDTEDTYLGIKNLYSESLFVQLTALILLQPTSSLSGIPVHFIFMIDPTPDCSV